MQSFNSTVDPAAVRQCQQRRTHHHRQPEAADQQPDSEQQQVCSATDAVAFKPILASAADDQF